MFAPCEDATESWKRLSLTVDSGACDNVVHPADVPSYEVQETRASKAGAAFASATSEAIANLGQLKVPMVMKEGTMKGMTFCAAEVTKPLASVRRICANGHTVVFDEAGSYIYNKATGEYHEMREDGGNYVLDVWIPPSSNDTSLVGNLVDLNERWCKSEFIARSW